MIFPSISILSIGSIRLYDVHPGIVFRLNKAPYISTFHMAYNLRRVGSQDELAIGKGLNQLRDYPMLPFGVQMQFYFINEENGMPVQGITHPRVCNGNPVAGINFDALGDFRRVMLKICPKDSCSALFL